MSFFLEKWYMDAVDPQGRAFIGYHAGIRFKKLRVTYSGCIRAEHGAVYQRSSFREPSVLFHHDGCLNWSTRSVKAEWHSTGSPVQEILLKSDDGDINWTCFFPEAAQIGYRKKDVLHGTGYAEKLVMSIPPWKLPINELRWGRFISATHKLVWIEWRGPHPKCLVVYNGTRITEALIEDDRIAWGNSTLIISEKKELRSGSVLSTVFSPFRWLKRYFPLRLLRTRETKWLSKGTFQNGTAAGESGWAIHEKVEWK
jgi:hypothetical protein